MSNESYAQARAEAVETMRLYAGVSEANRLLLAYLGRGEREVASAESAVAVRLVALLTKGVEVPSYQFLPIVLAPNGRRIRVTTALGERRGLFDGMVATQDINYWDEVAFVVFERGMPQAVHIIDSESAPLVNEMLRVEGVGKHIGLAPEGCTLSLLFHYNLMLEPTTAEVLGIRTFVFDESPDVGWRRVTVA